MQKNPLKSVPRFRAIPLAALWLAVSAVNCAQGEPRWPDERTFGVFHIHADYPLEKHATLFEQLAAIQRDVTEELGIQPPQETIHIFFFARKSTYQKYVRTYFPDAPTRRALYVKERGPGMVFAYDSGDFEEDVRHETTHALLHASLAFVPLWLDEGLAEYFESPPEERTHENPHFGPLQWDLRLGRIPSPEKLAEIDSLKSMGKPQYRYSWAWVHFMLHGPPAAKAILLRYLADIEAESPPGDLCRHLRTRLPDLETALTEHFRHWK